MTMRQTLSRAATVLIGLLLFVGSAAAQTALTSTTLADAVSSASANSLNLTSATSAEAGGVLYIDGEALDVLSVNGTAIHVRRGALGTRAAAHLDGALVYVVKASQKAAAFAVDQQRGGACVRANEAVLPQIDASAGLVYDCAVGSSGDTAWAPINADVHTVRSEAFNLDNGSGTTIDALLIRQPRPILIVACRIVYEDATAGTVAGGSAQVGTSVDGEQIVAATNYTSSATVGSTTAMTVLNGFVPAGTPVLVRHTGVATTQAGEAVVECDYVNR